jgi:ABC-type dipeptide/oligopeptide/nickel transport system permease component
MIAVLFIALGFVGSVVGVTAGVKALRGAKKASMIRAGVAAVFCASGSIPLFVLALFLMGFIYIIIGAFPALLFLLMVKTADRKTKE